MALPSLLWLALACSSSPAAPEASPPPLPQAPASTQDHLAAAVATDRPEEDRVRDADRHPAEVLAFFEVAPGQHVADLMTGRGYYAEILAHAVGPSGRVYAQNNAYVVDKFADGPLTERLTRMGQPQVVRVDAELDALGLPPSSLDAALMVLFWHDTYWMGLDRPAVLAQIHAALKPGGVFGLIDHSTAPGAGVDAVKTLHRIEESVVVAEVTAAGFELEAESDLLRHPEDDHTINVFDDAIRGKTDRFVLRFRKPREP